MSIVLPVKVFRVQVQGHQTFRILDALGAHVPYSERFFDRFESGTARTYAYALIDCFRWIGFEGLVVDRVSLDDLERYVTACVRWSRQGAKPPWSKARSSASPRSLHLLTTALTSYFRYVQSMNDGVGAFLPAELRVLGMRARQQMLLGHVRRSTRANELTRLVGAVTRPSPPRLPTPAQFESVIRNGATARDRALMRWLLDGGFRIGELLGLHFVDIHLSPDSLCGESAAPHVHVCDRPGLKNDARAKGKDPWRFDGTVISGGSVRFLSPAMTHTLFEYVTDQLPKSYAGPQLFVTFRGGEVSGPWTPAAARGVVRRAGDRAGIENMHPHLFRHRFATDVTKAAHGNAVITRLAGGWRSAATVEQVYNHPSLDDRDLSRALEIVWGVSE